MSNKNTNRRNPDFGSVMKELTPQEGEEVIGTIENTIVIPIHTEPEPEIESESNIDLESKPESKSEIIEAAIKEIETALKQNLTNPKSIFNLYSQYKETLFSEGIALLKEKSTEENFQKAVDRFDLIENANLIKSKIMSDEIDVLNLSDEDASILRRFKNLDLIEKLLNRKNQIYDEIAALHTEESEIKEKLSGLGITHIGSTKSSKKSGITGETEASSKPRRTEEKLFIKNLLEEGKYTEKQITMKTLERFPHYSSSACEAILRNSKNEQYTVFFSDAEKKNPLTIKINPISKIATLS